MQPATIVISPETDENNVKSEQDTHIPSYVCHVNTQHPRASMPLVVNIHHSIFRPQIMCIISSSGLNAICGLLSGLNADVDQLYHNTV